MKARGFVLPLLGLLLVAVISRQIQTTRSESHVLKAEIPEAAELRVLETYRKLPLRFEANQGQTDAQVKFLSRAGRYILFLTSTEAVLAWENPEPAFLRMKLVGANPQAQVVGVDPLPGKVHRFAGNDPSRWRTGISTFARVRYRDVYPGVDLVYYGNQDQLEYDWIASPGADPRNILIELEGAERLEVDGEGNLVLDIPGGQLQLRKPLVYQEAAGARKVVPGGYVLKGERRIAFHVSEYDPTRPLVIDPVLSFSSYFGGSGEDDGGGIAVDSTGIYVTSRTYSPGFPSTNPLRPYRGGEEVMVAKLNPSGSALIYFTYVGGSVGVGDDDGGHTIVVDSSGNAYVTGGTTATDFPTTLGAFDRTFNGVADNHVFKLDPSGALVWATYLGGTGFEKTYGSRWMPLATSM